MATRASHEQKEKKIKLLNLSQHSSIAPTTPFKCHHFFYKRSYNNIFLFLR